ncbi:hypothetical protein FJD32_001595 [Shewanella sp. LC6]|nr:hypothetical protein FJD32_001595 [Shewanella sp. LC6]TPE47793.1 hypothetical protein FJD33_22865 [Shewanella sp. LC2]
MMKTLSPFKAGLFAILASSAVFATTVNAEPGQGCDHPRGEFHKRGDRMEHDGMHRMFEGLDLTDAQKADIKKLFAEQRAARSDDKPCKEERSAHRAEMQAMQNQIYNLLTPEQQAKFKARFEAQAGKEPRG